MKINHIIRKKRKALSLTQAQLAKYLGVSTPAVNKWEKGCTYPDITLLPALARLLKTDLNTLMSFNEDLTDIEVKDFVNQINKITQKQGYETAFEIAINKIQEYPTCEKLIYSVVLYLNGALFLYSVTNQEHYKKIFETYYEQMSTSTVTEIRETALSMLISYNRERKNFSKAEELINSLQPPSLDKEKQLAVLYTQQGKYVEAEKIWEHKLLSSVADIQTALISMMEIAVNENRNSDAIFYADLYETVSNQFHISKWISYVAQFQLAVIKKDENKCLWVLRKMLPHLKAKWNPQDSPLYQKMQGNDVTALSNQLANMILNELKTSEEFSFIRENEKLGELIEELSDLIS